MAWGKVGSKTVATQTNEYTVDDITASDFNFCIASTNVSGNQGNSHFRFNGSTGTTNEYAFRTFRDFEYLGDGTTQALIPFAGWSDGTKRYFTFSWIYNKSDKEKLTVGADMSQNTAGSGASANVPHQGHMAGKWVKGTPEAITKITFNDSSSGEISADTTFNMLGSDVTPAPSTPAVPAIPSLMPNLPSGSVGGWVELGRTSNASLPDVTGLADKRYLMFLNFQESNNSRPAPAIIINGDTDPNYARRGNANGLTDYTNVNQPQIMFGGQPEGNTTTVPYFTVGYIANKSDKEKLAICHNTLSYQLGASGSDPLERRDTVFKWTNTSEPIDQLTITNFLSGSFTTNGELIVLGWDPTDTHTTNFWEELASVTLGTDGDVLSSGTISAKKYLWVQAFIKNSGDTARFNTQVTFNDDTSNNYAMRRSFDGGSDSTSTSASNLFSSGVTGSNDDLWCMNLFILNNASNEKLCIAHGFDTYIGSGAGNAPSQRYEAVGKWTNTHNQITKIDITNTDTSNYDAISELRVWGSD